MTTKANLLDCCENWIREGVPRDEFTRIVARAMKLIPSFRTKMMNACDVSGITVDRWVSGESAPHPSGRKTVLRLVKELLG